MFSIPTQSKRTLIPGVKIAFLMGMFCCATASAQLANDCGPLENAYGPFDYTNPDHFQNKLPIVERQHFSKETEALQGIVNKDIGAMYGDRYVVDHLDYTLRAFPNHHRALYTMAQYHIQRRNRKMPMRYTAECYFVRALQFKPADSVVHMIFGLYNYRMGDSALAISEYQKALKLNPESAETHYNLGLAYLNQDRLSEAEEHALRAYQLGFPLPGLKNQLKQRGRLKELNADGS